MANPARSDGVPPWTVENYVLQNPCRGGKSLEIARLEHINGDEPYSILWARVHNTENSFIESFNGKLRDECLNANQFLSIDDARSKIEA
jgi:Integrase core domain